MANCLILSVTHGTQFRDHNQSHGPNIIAEQSREYRKVPEILGEHCLCYTFQYYILCGQVSAKAFGGLRRELVCAPCTHTHASLFSKVCQNKKLPPEK